MPEEKPEIVAKANYIAVRGKGKSNEEAKLHINKRLVFICCYIHIKNELQDRL